MKYREEIDGLRALAVMLVVVSHLGIYPFSGGFLGVDVFFVISGYLITSQIVGKVAEGRFSFTDFYLKRIRRISPAIVVLLALLTLFNLGVLLPSSLKNYINFPPYVTLGLGNLPVSNLKFGYFDAAVERYQLVHAWSLGVEEQFYLIVPVLFVMLWKLKNPFGRNSLIAGLFITALSISVFFAFYKPGQDTYYLIHTRFFEMFIGCILAIFTKDNDRSLSRPLNEFLSMTSFAVLLIFSVILDDSSVWPGFNAFAVCIATALLLILGKSDQSDFTVKSLLSLPPVRFVGRISYSLYLYHWVIISTLIELGVDVKSLHLLEKLFLTSVFILVSYGSWKYVENAFRYKFLFSFRKSIFVWVVAPTAVFGSLIIIDVKFPSLLYNSDLINKSSYENNRVIAPVVSVKPEGLASKLSEKYRRSEYLIGNKTNSGEAETLVLANSHFHAFRHFLKSQLETSGLVAHVMHESSTLVYTEPFAPALYEEKLKDKKFVVIWARVNATKFYGTDLPWFEWIIKKALELNVTPIVYVPGFEANDKLTARGHQYATDIFKVMENDVYSKDAALAKIPSRAVFTNVYQKYLDQVRWIDFKPYLCDTDHCDFVYEEDYILFDDHHITLPTGQRLGGRYMSDFGNIFSSTWKTSPVLL